MNILVIDTETGGVDPEQHSILSLAGVLWTDGSIGPRFEIDIVEPTLVVTPGALAINRIDLVTHCQRAVNPTEAMQSFERFLRLHLAEELNSSGKITLAGHNVGFDVSFLKRLCRLAGVRYADLFSHRVLDTASILRFLTLTGILPSSITGSNEAFAYFGIDIPERERHTAMADATATALMLSKLTHLVRPQDTGNRRYAIT